MARADHYHLLDSEDGWFLLEIEVCDGLAEFSDPYSHDFTMDVEGLHGEQLYKELHDHAAFELGLDHEDCYLTDENESTILAA